jgi:hypothetical protein
MQPTLVSARRVLFLLTAPLLKTFFEHVRQGYPGAAGNYVQDVVDRLRERVGGVRPRLWTVEIREETASAVMQLARQGEKVALGDLLRDPMKRETCLACVPLVVRSEQDTVVLPQMSYLVNAGDQILFCGTNPAYRLLDATLNNEYTLRYLVTGVDAPRGFVMQWVWRKMLKRRFEERRVQA